MPVSDGTDGILECGVCAEHRAVVDGEVLEVHVRADVVFGEEILWQEVDGRLLKACGDNDDVGIDVHLFALVARLGSALPEVKVDSIRSNLVDVAAEIVSKSIANVPKDRAVDDGRASVKALRRRHLLFQIAVVQLAEENFRDPAEESLPAKRLQAEQEVDDGETGDDPFVTSSENDAVFRLLLDGELEGCG